MGCESARAAGWAGTLFLVALFAVSGCQPQTADWIKPGATSTDLTRDLADCEREGTGHSPFHFQALSEDYETARDQITRRKNACMKGRGWQPVGGVR